MTFGAVKKKQGAKEVVTEIIKEETTKEQKAVKEAFKEKKRVEGLSDAELQKRIDDRTEKWGKR